MQAIPLRLLPHSIGWRVRTGVDDHGKPTYGTSTTVTGCMDARGDMDVLTIGGEVIVPKGRVVVGTPQGIEVDDEVTLPDGSVARVLQVLRPTGPSTSAHHETVVYG